MSVIDTLVTNRTPEQAGELRRLKQTPFADMTAAQQARFLNDLAGSYSWVDLNRVAQACAYVYGVFQAAGYDVPGYTALKDDWTETDKPNLAFLNAYLGSVAVLKARLNTAQELPTTMRFLTTEGANNIEKLLIAVDDTLTRLQSAYWYSGEIQAGEE